MWKSQLSWKLRELGSWVLLIGQLEGDKVIVSGPGIGQAPSHLAPLPGPVSRGGAVLP